MLEVKDCRALYVSMLVESLLSLLSHLGKWTDRDQEKEEQERGGKLVEAMAEVQCSGDPLPWASAYHLSPPLTKMSKELVGAVPVN